MSFHIVTLRDLFIIAEKRWIWDSDRKEVPIGIIDVQALLYIIGEGFMTKSNIRVLVP